MSDPNAEDSCYIDGLEAIAATRQVDDTRAASST